MPEQALDLWPWMHFVGRVLFSSFMVLFGLRHLFDLRASAAFLERKHVPGPIPVSVVAGLMLTVGGGFVLLGWHRFIGAGLLFLVLFPGAWALHPFWNETDPQVRHDEMGQFFKTLGLAGAALLIAHYGGAAWPLSVGN
jgi:uncharacterized membrane protein YphA (DoxX/SURF4 family)